MRNSIAIGVTLEGMLGQDRVELGIALRADPQHVADAASEAIGVERALIVGTPSVMQDDDPGVAGEPARLQQAATALAPVDYEDVKTRPKSKGATLRRSCSAPYARQAATLGART
jgi:hypothetical protein